MGTDSWTANTTVSKELEHRRLVLACVAAVSSVRSYLRKVSNRQAPRNSTDQGGQRKMFPITYGKGT